VTLHWDAAVQETLAPTDVEVRISKHPSGSLVLEVRDPADQQPVLVVVGSRPEHAGAKAAWTFGPFTFSAGSPRCMTSADACNWTFSALNLNVEAGEQKLELHAQGSGSMTSDGSTFAIMHGYIFEQSTVGTESCGGAKSWHQNFALMRISPIVEE
jgi:hypothetical protein